MKERFSDAQVGDKVYDRVYGFGVIHSIKYPIAVFWDCPPNYYRFKITEYLMDGKIYDESEPTLFYVDGDNKYATKRPKPKVPWNKVPVDTKIFVGCRKRHHAGNKFFFLYGCTSHTANSKDIEATTSPVTLAEEVTIDGITYPIGSE